MFGYTILLITMLYKKISKILLVNLYNPLNMSIPDLN